MGLNIPGYTLFSVGGLDSPRACILPRNTNAWMLPKLSCRYLVAVLISYNVEEERHLVVFLLIYIIILWNKPPAHEFEEHL